VFTRLISRNTTIPCEKSQVFSTAADNQTQVGIKVLQGEREMAADNKSLGEFELVGIPPSPRGVPQIEVSFNIDVNGIVQVRATDKATKKEQRITIQSDGGLSESDIARMVEEAEKHSAEDRNRKEFVEAKNQADSLIYSSQQSLVEHGSKISDASKEMIEKSVEKLRASLDRQDDTSTIKEGVKELEAAMMKIGEEIYKGQKSAPADSADTNNADSTTVDAEYEEKPKDK
jgi:molecular chaperone DnaK (HSP70)